MSETLKPCPWCEEPSDIVFVRTSTKYGKMWCNSCGATGPTSFSDGDGDNERSPPAIKAWNARHQQTARICASCGARDADPRPWTSQGALCPACEDATLHPHVAQTDSLTGDELKDQNDE